MIPLPDQKNTAPAGKISQNQYWDEINEQISTEEIRLEENFFPPHYPPRKLNYMEDFFKNILKDWQDKNVLSIGGGIDKVGLYLAKKGNRIVLVEISDGAIEKTSRLAKQLGIQDNLKIIQAQWEPLRLEAMFDAVVTHDALHHLQPEQAIDNIYRVLKPGGLYLGMEPICLPESIRLIHKKFPSSAPFMFKTEDEIELKKEHLNYLKKKFHRLDFYFFDVFTRPSVFYCLHELGWRRLLKTLTRLDFLLTKFIPLLRPLSSYIIFKAEK
jgi:SAM-dependent methyltransferase